MVPVTRMRGHWARSAEEGMFAVRFPPHIACQEKERRTVRLVEVDVGQMGIQLRAPFSVYQDRACFVREGGAPWWKPPTHLRR